MAVFVIAGNGLLSIPTEDDYTPEQLCSGDCEPCSHEHGGACVARMRHLELLADAFMLEGLEAGA
jgi:hypothetical protein